MTSAMPMAAMEQALALADQRLERMWALTQGDVPCTPVDGPLRIGVDLGTAHVMVAVLDADGEPVAGATEPARVVKDGLVTDYFNAVRIVQRLVSGLEEQLGRPLRQAACAIPPGTGAGAERITANVLESAGLDVTGVVDEPTAAGALLGIKDGAVVDVGGGTTGISVLRGGEVAYTADEPTGGTHFTLVLAGHLNLTFEEAERVKVSPEHAREVTVAVRPVMEKVAVIVANHLRRCPAERVYLVGGTACMPGIGEVLERVIKLPVVIPARPPLVTPMGIALSSTPQEG